MQNKKTKIYELVYHKINTYKLKHYEFLDHYFHTFKTPICCNTPEMLSNLYSRPKLFIIKERKTHIIQ